MKLGGGGTGAGRGEPLALRIETRGGGGTGAGRGEPLAERTTRLGGGGTGAGSGEPLALRIETLGGGGTGAGSGPPLTVRMSNFGGGGTGAGKGDPLKIAKPSETAPLLEMCLTELLTGSTIEAIATSNANRIEAFFMMVEPLLGSTLRKFRTSRA
jgi:hypothetical protein